MTLRESKATLPDGESGGSVGADFQIDSSLPF